MHNWRSNTPYFSVSLLVYLFTWLNLHFLFDSCSCWRLTLRASTSRCNRIASRAPELNTLNCSFIEKILSSNCMICDSHSWSRFWQDLSSASFLLFSGRKWNVKADLSWRSSTLASFVVENLTPRAQWLYPLKTKGCISAEPYGLWFCRTGNQHWPFLTLSWHLSTAGSVFF